MTKRCEYPGCRYNAKSRGLCGKHYKRYKRIKDAVQIHKAEAVHIYDYSAVYVLGADEVEYVKVGRSTNLPSRRESIQTGFPYRVKIYDAFFARPEITNLIEWETQKNLTDFGLHVRGEWFDVSPEDAAKVIKKTAEMSNHPILSLSSYMAQRNSNKGMMLDRFKKSDEDERMNSLANEIDKIKAIRTVDTHSALGHYYAKALVRP